eukprot:scaffold397_cov403-Prasinococcus_capsulatus_cf.AAC.8
MMLMMYIHVHEGFSEPAGGTVGDVWVGMAWGHPGHTRTPLAKDQRRAPQLITPNWARGRPAGLIGPSADGAITIMVGLVRPGPSLR